MEKICQNFEEKLCTLLSFLTQLPAELEMIADEIDNENLKNALSMVADESIQYAKELNAQLRSLEIKPPHLEQSNLGAALLQQDFSGLGVMKGREVSSICEKSEAFFTKLYMDILGDYLPNTSLSAMMNYQLLGIKSAFMRIRFLNSLRFSS
ncbi:MAG: hypothetical protein V4725_06795 [Bacteroidota bacterium]